MPADGQPLVSVCIPVHNDAGVVADALGSAMRQGYTPLEIVVIDNCSTDDTLRVVAETAAGDRRVRVISNAENIGMARNFSKCVEEAAGAFVTVLCADDVLEDRCIEKLASALHEHPQAVLAACGRVITDASLEPSFVLQARRRQQEVSSLALSRECFSRGNLIGEPSAVLFRRAEAARGFDSRYSQSLDLEMWLHLLEKGSAVLIPDPLCRIRQHAGQATRRNMRSGRIVSDKQLLFRQYAAKLEASLTPMEKLAWDARMASSVARTGAAGGVVDVSQLTELFYPRIFSLVLRPLAGMGWTLRGVIGSQRL